jgi:serine/threonine protein kinase
LAYGLLKKNPKERLTAAQALEHAWFKKEFKDEKILQIQNFQFRDSSAE